MIAVVVGDEDLANFPRIKPVITYVGQDCLEVTVYPAAGIDDREFCPAVDHIDMTIKSSGDAKSIISSTNHMNVAGEFHLCLLYGKESFRKGPIRPIADKTLPPC